MTMPRKTLKSQTITVEDYYSERFLHVETELRHQRELMKIGFDTMNKRFEDMNKRFDAVDKRFDATREEMNRRFDVVDKRFETIREDMNIRFEASDKRFDSLTIRMDRFMIWSFGITLTSSGLIIAAIKYWR